MKKANILAASLTLALTTPSASFANSLTGFNISGEIQFKSSGGTLKATGPGNWAEVSYGGEQDTILGINLGYTFAIGSRMAVQAGIAADLGETTAYEYSDSDGDSAEGIEKDQYSVYIAPGYMVTPQTMIYGRLSLHSGRVEYTVSDPINSDTYKSKHTGIGFGAGVRTALTDNMYLYTEALRVGYNKKTLDRTVSSTLYLTPDSTVARTGFGYRF